MRRLLPLFVLAASALVPASAPADEPPADQPRWYTDFAKAEAEAKRLQVPLLVHFYADWCGPCRRMERETLHSSEFFKQLGDRFIAVKINTDDHRALVKRFNVVGLPTDVYIEPDGRVMAQITGYQDRKSYLGRMARMEAQFGRSHKTYIAKAHAEPEFPIAAPAPPVLGLDGYSPVSLWNWREWRKGKPEFAVVYQGVEFHLASSEEVRQFDADPARYVPELLGCDPVVLWDTERAVPGSTKFGAYFDGELYLFTTAESRRRFKDDPKRFIETRHVLRIEEIDTTELR